VYVGSLGSYADLFMYHRNTTQLTGLHKQKDSGNKIKIQMQPTKNFIRFDEPQLYPEDVSPNILT